MIRILSRQLITIKRMELERWFEQRYPERTLGQPKELVADYLDSRSESARALGFNRPSQLRFLIGYEIDCGIPWISEQEDRGPSALVTASLRDVAMAPKKRIERAETMLYGRVI